jgi:hypothetical protein
MSDTIDKELNCSEKLSNELISYLSNVRNHCNFPVRIQEWIVLEKWNQ